MWAMILILVVPSRPPLIQEVAFFRTDELCEKVAGKLTREENRRAEEDGLEHRVSYYCEQVNRKVIQTKPGE